MDWRINYYEAKYHLSIANRMFRTYEDYPEKRILIGAIRELSESVEKIIQTFLIRDKVEDELKMFVEKIGPKYMDETTLKNIIQILKIKKDQESAKVEFTKNSCLLLFSDEKWTILKLSRLKQFRNSVKNVIENFRQI